MATPTKRAHENISSRLFEVFRDYSNSLNLYKVGELSSTKLEGTAFKLRKRRKINRRVLHFFGKP